MCALSVYSCVHANNGYQNPYEVTTEDKAASQDRTPAQISLTDCLACSGCVTSAEAVLVSLQSHSEVLNTLDAHLSILSGRDADGCLQPESVDGSTQGKVFIASVSPQVRASIAATYGISERSAGWMIDQLLGGSLGLASGGNHGSGFTWIVDTNALREACLVLGADEVASSLSGSANPASASTSVPKKPILTSACPGWICYAEKTHPHVLGHLSRLKSPQALAGTLIKTVLSQRLNIRPDQIWHLAIMPCFDKKLEASREELTDVYWRPSFPSQEPTPPIRDVDCVITARELLMLADTRGIGFPSLPREPLHTSSTPPFPDPTLDAYLFPHRHQHTRKRRRRNQDPWAGPSGGYLHHILQTQLSLNPDAKLHTTRGRNQDVVEYAITRPSTSASANANGETGLGQEEETIFKAARYYGSRNITNLVRKLKPPQLRRLPGAVAAAARASKFSSTGTSKPPSLQPAARANPSTNSMSDYAYVEVMACPGGCTNGGGQIKIDDLGDQVRNKMGKEGMTQKEWLARVDEAYFSGSGSSSDSGSELEGEGGDNGDVMMQNGGDDGVGDGNDEEEEVINGIDVKNVRAMLKHWSECTGIGLEKLCYTSFRAVESDVGKVDKGGGQDRVVELAGRIGGGW